MRPIADGLTFETENPQSDRLLVGVWILLMFTVDPVRSGRVGADQGPVKPE
jgi:hypothetical protein